MLAALAYKDTTVTFLLEKLDSMGANRRQFLGSTKLGKPTREPQWRDCQAKGSQEPSLIPRIIGSARPAPPRLIACRLSAHTLPPLGRDSRPLTAFDLAYRPF